MKNLLNKHNIEDLEELPIDTLSLKITKSLIKYTRWNYYGSDIHDTDNISPYTRVKRIIENNIGKSFSLAFSYYCKQVPKYQQHVFLEEFNNDINSRYTQYFYIDEDGLIQRKKDIKRRFVKPKREYTVQSDDYKFVLVHKITGHLKTKFEPVYDGNKNYYYNSKVLYYEYGVNHFNTKPLWQRYKATDNDFEIKVISGWIKYFKSKNDPEFKRYHSEKRKQRRLQRKFDKILLKEKQYCFLTESEQKKKINKVENDTKIVAHGFDLVTSFRNM